MTFEQFQATREWTDNLGEATESGFDDKASGQVYAEKLCIESALHMEGATGPYVLTIGTSQKFGDLDALERDLYDFAVSEGYWS